MIKRASLALALTSVLGVASATTVGETHRSTTTPTAALRDAAHSDTLAITVWYPAIDGAREEPLDMGSPGHPLFLAGKAAQEAPFAPGKHPVVLLSHGFGGTARMMSWFGTELARDGYVVVGVNHPGNNGMGPMTVAGAALWWERAEDLKAAFAAVRKDKTIAAHIDPARLGVAGFSAGGFTAFLLAGATVDLPRLEAFCDAHPADGVCKPQKEAPEISGPALRNSVYSDPVLQAQLAHAKDNHSIPAVKAVFAIAPALVQAIAPDSFARIHVPTAIVLGVDDKVAEPATNGDIAVKAIPGATITRLPGVGHYDFLSTCTAAAKASVSICADVKLPQEATHAEALAKAKALFDSAL
ncbi:alpha/beta hydrolase family protein [Luteibacter sp. HA06]